jgi:hypothetical protein
VRGRKCMPDPNREGQALQAILARRLTTPI